MLTVSKLPSWENTFSQDWTSVHLCFGLPLAFIGGEKMENEIIMNEKVKDEEYECNSLDMFPSGPWVLMTWS